MPRLITNDSSRVSRAGEDLTIQFQTEHIALSKELRERLNIRGGESSIILLVCGEGDYLDGVSVENQVYLVVTDDTPIKGFRVSTDGSLKTGKITNAMIEPFGIGTSEVEVFVKDSNNIVQYDASGNEMTTLATRRNQGVFSVLEPSDITHLLEEVADLSDFDGIIQGYPLNLVRQSAPSPDRKTTKAHPRRKQ